MGQVFRLCLVTSVNTALAFLPLLTPHTLEQLGQVTTTSGQTFINLTIRSSVIKCAFISDKKHYFCYIYLLFKNMTMIHQAKTKQRSTGLFCFSSRLRLCLSSSCILGSRSRGGCWQDQDQTPHLRSEAHNLQPHFQTTRSKTLSLFGHFSWKLG